MAGEEELVPVQQEDVAEAEGATASASLAVRALFQEQRSELERLAANLEHQVNQEVERQRREMDVRLRNKADQNQMDMTLSMYEIRAKELVNARTMVLSDEVQTLRQQLEEEKKARLELEAVVRRLVKGAPGPEVGVQSQEQEQAPGSEFGSNQININESRERVADQVGDGSEEREECVYVAPVPNLPSAADSTASIPVVDLDLESTEESQASFSVVNNDGSEEMEQSVEGPDLDIDFDSTAETSASSIPVVDLLEESQPGPSSSSHPHQPSPSPKSAPAPAPVARKTRARAPDVEFPTEEMYVFLEQKKMFRCRLCPKEYSAKRGVRVHYKTVHLGLSYNCPVPECGHPFSRPAERDRHYRSVHLKEKLFVCELCGKDFGRKDQLKPHQKTHESGVPVPVPESPNNGIAQIVNDIINKMI